MNTLPAVGARPLKFDAISASDLSHVQSASDRDHIGSLPSRVWDRIADFFCGTDRGEAKKCLFDMYASTTPDAQKIALFLELRGLAGAGVQDCFQHRVENGRETFALVLDGQDPDTGVILTRTAIGCNLARIQEELNSDRSAEDLETQLREAIVRGAFEVAGHAIPDDGTLALAPRQTLRLQLLDQALDQLGCTPAQKKAVHALANQATPGLVMQSTLSPDPAFAPVCPSSANQYTAYSIRREQGELRLLAQCRQDVAQETNEEYRNEKLESIREMDNFYQSLDVRVDIAIDSSGNARLADLMYHGTK